MSRWTRGKDGTEYRVVGLNGTEFSTKEIADAMARDLGLHRFESVPAEDDFGTRYSTFEIKVPAWEYLDDGEYESFGFILIRGPVRWWNPLSWF